MKITLKISGTFLVLNNFSWDASFESCFRRAGRVNHPVYFFLTKVTNYTMIVRRGLIVSIETTTNVSLLSLL